MTDPLDILKKTFEDAPVIKASVKAKQAALNAAMSAFEVELEKDSQGKPVETRLNKRDNKFVDLLTFSRWRKSMQLNYILPGVAGLAALSFVVLNVSQFIPGVENKLGTQDVVESDFYTMLPEKRKEERVPRHDMAQNLPETVPNSLKMSKPVMADSDAKSLQESAMGASKMNQSKSRVAVESVATLVNPMNSNTMRMQQAASEEYAAGRSMLVPEDMQMPVPLPSSRDKFDVVEDNPLKFTRVNPVSTFSIDVDTAAYSFMRARLNQNILPPKNSVRVEEFINYFPYDYAAPEDNKVPFSVHTTVYPNPWNHNTRLLHVGIKGYELPGVSQPHSNLVFLIDTSGSMNQHNKLPLLKNAFKLLLSTLSDDDTVAIVSYAGSAGVVLEPTRAKDQAAIIGALSRLNAGGSTAGGEGIHLAYQLAQSTFDPKGVNRVILATDGDFNVGISDHESLKGFIERKRDTGVFLSVLGFGMGNYNDALMQTLAQNGNGTAAYIDSLSEARKVLVEEASSSLFIIAKDVKIQMEFNPDAVSEYRLIGYESRKLKNEDFNNDKVDAGDIGSGHSVTAIYEITPTGSAGKRVDDLRYQREGKTQKVKSVSEYGFLKLRYKLPEENASELIEQPIMIEHQLKSIDSASDDIRFSSAVAAYGQLLRGGKYLGNFNYDDVIRLALQAKGQDNFGYRGEFINLVRLAKSADKM